MVRCQQRSQPGSVGDDGVPGVYRWVYRGGIHREVYREVYREVSHHGTPYLPTMVYTPTMPGTLPTYPGWYMPVCDTPRTYPGWYMPVCDTPVHTLGGVYIQLCLSGPGNREAYTQLCLSGPCNEEVIPGLGETPVPGRLNPMF